MNRRGSFGFSSSFVHICFIFSCYDSLTMKLMNNTSADAPATDRSSLDDSLRPPPRLTPDLERRFQTDYYARIRPGLRLVSLLLAGLTATQALVQSGFLSRLRPVCCIAKPRSILFC